MIIQTESLMISDSADIIPVTADIPHLLKVLSEAMNSDPYAAIREYVSNAHDASLGLPGRAIHVRCHDTSIVVEDRGRGMTREVIQNAFTRIGGRFGANPDLIGAFGVGVLTAFMISERLVVETRSELEPHGWRLEWPRGEQHFTLRPIERSEYGTTATMHLARDSQEMAYESGLRNYIARVLGLLPIPVYVGRSELPVNAHHAWLRDHRLHDKGKLLVSSAAHDILRQYCHLGLIAAYGATGPDGSHVLLGIPVEEHAPLQSHKVQFFSRGVWICSEIPAFFPESLAFVVGIIDHPGFALQLSRESFRLDRTFCEVRNAIEMHILQFLELLGEQQPRILAAVMSTHSTMLNAHRRRQPRLRPLFRDHYRFNTTMGNKTWQELRKLTRPATLGGTHYERLLFYLSEEGTNLHLLPIAESRGYLVVLAVNGERDLLQDFGRADGVQIEDLGRFMDGMAIVVPEAFRALAARLTPELRRHRISAVTFFSLPGESSHPVELQIASVPQGQRPGRELATVDSLMLNVGHPVIEKLAAVCHRLPGAALSKAADALFSIAALRSPLQETQHRVRGIVAQHLLDALQQTLGGGGSSTVWNTEPRCFVALPYRDSFEPVWTTIQSVLQAPPYEWNVVRADLDVHKPLLLEGVLNHIENSRRFIADVSGESASVLIELGMMLQKDAMSTLLLVDEDTFERLPTDIKGVIYMVYPAALRDSPTEFKAWFEREIRSRRHFIAMYGGKSQATPWPEEIIARGA